MKKSVTPVLGLLILSVFTGACQATPSATPQAGEAALKVLAVESFLADIAQNVAGGRLTVGELLPLGLDPHAFMPTPKDVARIADSNVLIVNGAGLEKWLANILENAGGQRLVIEASTGLTPRLRSAEGIVCAPPSQAAGDEHANGGDPHFWLDPVLVIRYVENIRDGFSQADPQGKEDYARDAEAYIARLKELDAWIAAQVAQIPSERRLLVTNHESLGYFADRYGFKLIGAILPSFSTGASPSAGDLARLADCIKSSGAPAIFLESGANPQLADQLAQETGIRVVTELYSHSITPPGGNAPDYIAMMKYNTQAIVDALK
jgi:ABC-type Zn uptake system ZnuABC Zn-binding protein ZnuA